MLDITKLGAGLRRLRVERGETRAGLARRLQVDAYYLRGWERGEPMQLHKLGEVLDALGCNLCDLERAMELAELERSAGLDEPADAETLLSSGAEAVNPSSLAEPPSEVVAASHDTHPSMLADAERLGRALRLLREDRGHSLRQLAEKTGMKLQQISVYEKASSRPMVGKLIELLNALDAGLGELHEALVLASARLVSSRGASSDEDAESSGVDELRLALLALGYRRPTVAEEARLFEQLDAFKAQLREQLGEVGTPSEVAWRQLKGPQLRGSQLKGSD